MQNFLKTPYLPSGPVTRVVIAGDAPPIILDSLSSLGIETIHTEPIKALPSSLSRHTDLQLVNVCEGVIVYAPETSLSWVEELNAMGFETIKGKTFLEGTYPGDIAYNCAMIGNRVFLNPRFTDPTLLEILKKIGLKIIPVKQGYAKCSTAILCEEAIITADVSIHKAALSEGLDSLFIRPQVNIGLKGYNYGFIGGSTGLISRECLAFFGDFKTLTQADVILRFMEKYGILPLSLSHANLVDLGGLIPLCSV